VRQQLGFIVAVDAVLISTGSIVIVLFVLKSPELEEYHLPHVIQVICRHLLIVAEDLLAYTSADDFLNTT
jgi:hypothetical protein